MATRPDNRTSPAFRFQYDLIRADAIHAYEHRQPGAVAVFHGFNDVAAQTPGKPGQLQVADR